jgi:hypothetical protein
MWTNKKYKAAFKGSYQRTTNDRVFTLTAGKKVISFESWQQAKKLGWSKI